MAGIILTGLLLVLKNISGIRFAPQAIVLLGVLHLILVLLFLISTLFCAVFRKPWTRDAH